MPKTCKIDIKSIKFLLNSNATEDLEKVIDVLYSLVPGDIDPESVEVSHLDGGYNNPIKFIEFETQESETIIAITKNLALNLLDKDKTYLNKQFYQRLTNKSLFIFRLKKHYLALNQYSLTEESDSVNIRIKFYDEQTGRSKKLDTDKIKEYLLNTEIIKAIG